MALAHRYSGESVCITGTMTLDTHGAYFLFSDARPDYIYGDRITLSTSPADLLRQGHSFGTHEQNFCGTLENLDPRAPDSGSQNRFLLHETTGASEP